ncbi:hypothetical protein ACHAQH_005255 [Verticillium albo-atrum]
MFCSCLKFRKRGLRENPQDQTVTPDSKELSLPKGGSFQFRRCEPDGSMPYGDEETPEFNLESVSRALSQGWDPNTSWNEDELVSTLPRPSVGVPWSYFNTAIHRALWLNQLDVADCLLNHGADIDQLNASGRTVLHEAIGQNLLALTHGWSKTLA